MSSPRCPQGGPQPAPKRRPRGPKRPQKGPKRVPKGSPRVQNRHQIEDKSPIERIAFSLGCSMHIFVCFHYNSYSSNQRAPF